MSADGRGPSEMDACVAVDLDAGQEGTDLVSRAIRGDFSAFEQIYRQHVAWIHSICLRMTADRGRAEELTQEAFVRAWQKLGSFRGESGLRTWLRRLTVNVVLSELRSTGRRPVLTQEAPEERGPAAPAARPGLGMDLDRAVAGLPTGARLVFVLHDVEGYRHDEIGRLLRISTGTSKGQLHRARRLLREALGS